MRPHSHAKVAHSGSIRDSHSVYMGARVGAWIRIDLRFTPRPTRFGPRLYGIALPRHRRLTMNSHLISALRRTCFSICVIASPALSAAGTGNKGPRPNDAIPALKSMHTDELLVPACGTEGMRELESAVRSLAQAGSPADAWELAWRALCSTRKESARYIARHSPKRIVLSAFDTGDESKAVRWIDRSALFMPEGKAWGAGAKRGNSDAQIVITYWKDEACVESLTLERRAKTWSVVAGGSACD